MLNQVLGQIQLKQAAHFTGHIKFGVENNTVVSMTVTNRIDNSVIGNVDNYDDSLKELVNHFPVFYGTLDFNMDFGSVTSFVYSTTLKGDELKAVISESEKCRSVKIVVKQ